MEHDCVGRPKQNNNNNSNSNTNSNNNDKLLMLLLLKPLGVAEPHEGHQGSATANTTSAANPNIVFP